MSRLISLSRIIAINWYGFRQVIDVDNTILLSGVSGGGKSALLDLVQRVLLGEKWRPNRAAAGAKKGRTEVSYVLCDTNAKENAEAHYTRRNGACYIALEFSWPLEKGQEEPRRETWGWRIQYDSPTSTPSRVHFLIPERTGWTTFTRENELLSEDDFKQVLRREYGNDCLFNQREYLAEMATPHHLWFNEERMGKTMPKAIAFEPEDDIEAFIREFILEAAPIEVKDVRKSVLAYRETQARLAKQENEAEYLRRIRDFHATFEVQSRAATLFTHVRLEIECARLREVLARDEAKLTSLNETHAEENRQYVERTAEVERLNEALNEFTLDAEEQELEGKRSEKRRKVADKTRIVEARQSVRQRLRTLAQHWRQWLERGREQSLEGLAEILTVDHPVLDALGATDEMIGLEALPTMAARFNELCTRIEKALKPIEQRIDAADAELRGIIAVLERLEVGQTPGSFPLFEAIRKALSSSSTPPEQLCRMIEILPQAEDDGWRKALELVLGRARFSIVIGSMEDYRVAMNLVRQQTRGDESVIHPGEARSLGENRLAGSLAEKVEVTSAVAECRAIAESYVHHLIGRIHAAESEGELDRAPERAVTRDGIYKQKPIRRKLTQRPELDYMLGKQGLKRVKENALREQREATNQRNAAVAIRGEIMAWVDLGKSWDLGSTRLPDRHGELSRLPELEQEIAALSARIDFLETPEREARIIKLGEMRKELAAAHIAIGTLRTSRDNYAQARRVLDESVSNNRSRLENQEGEIIRHRATLKADVHAPEILGHVDALCGEFHTWDERRNAADKRSSDADKAGEKARRDRDMERQGMIGAVDKQGRPLHPEYRSDYNPADEDNDRWEARLRTLEDFELEKYRTLAADRRQDWEKRLREHVLNRLNDNLDAAERTVKELRKYLDRQVRGHRYEITQRRDSSYATLFTLLANGFEPSDSLSEVGRTSEVQAALDELMAAVEAPADKADDRARRLLDYRYYHHYDLHMINVAGGVKAQPISLGQSGASLSGGENQVPFFISMLAAFRRVYDLGSARSNHLGLVVMDEAFAKLSGDGIEDCLELAKEFDLQLFMAFPIDKLGIMVPFADTIIVCEKEEERDANGYVIAVDNIPTRITKEQAVASIA